MCCFVADDDGRRCRILGTKCAEVGQNLLVTGLKFSWCPVFGNFESSHLSGTLDLSNCSGTCLALEKCLLM